MLVEVCVAFGPAEPYHGGGVPASSGSPFRTAAPPESGSWCSDSSWLRRNTLFCNGYIRNVQCRKDVINEKKKKRRAHTFQGVDELVSEYAMCERGRRHGHGATVAVNKERRERGGRGERGDVVGLHCADIDPPVLGRRQFSAWNAFNPNHSARLPYGS